MQSFRGWGSIRWAELPNILPHYLQSHLALGSLKRDDYGKISSVLCWLNMGEVELDGMLKEVECHKMQYVVWMMPLTLFHLYEPFLLQKV